MLEQVARVSYLCNNCSRVSELGLIVPTSDTILTPELEELHRKKIKK